MVSRKRAWVALAAGAVLATAAGVAVNRVGGSALSQLASFSVASVLFLAAGAAARWGSARESNGEIRLQTADAKGRPVRLGDATLGQLGVHWSRAGDGGDDYGPYAARDIDPALADAMRSGQPLVAVAGAALAGRSRTLANAARRHEAGSLLARFEDVPGAKLAELIAAATGLANSAPAVLWLENPALAMLSQLSPELLGSLPRSLRIFMTIDADLLNAGVLDGDAAQVLNAPGRSIRLGLVTESERARLTADPNYRQLAEAHQDQPVLMGQLMISLDRVTNAMTTPDDDAICRVALLRAAADWQRIAVPFLLTRVTIEKLYRSGYWQELAGRGRMAAASRSGFRIAMKRLLAPASGWGLRLLEDVYVGASTHLRPHALVTVVADSSQRPPGWPVSEVLWNYLAENLDGSERVTVGLTAVARGDYGHAGRILDIADAAKIPADVMLRIAFAAWDAQEFASAYSWFTKAARSGHADQAPEAMFNLGILEAEQGRTEEARRWYEKAAGSGHADQAPRAMNNLGILEVVQGRTEEARGWFAKAADVGYATALNNLGRLEAEQGRTEEARRWYEKAAGSGHADQAPRAMNSLGILEEEQGRIEQARRWYEKAAESGHADQAPEAMFHLGRREEELGRIDKARDLYTNGAESGPAHIRQAAMNYLGLLEEAQGRTEEARGWYGRAIESDHAPAMNNLGLLEEAQGRTEEARRWYVRAIGSDHVKAAPIAMNNLGLLEQRQGRTEEARRWYIKAAESGDPKIVQRARDNLDELRRHAEDMLRAKQFAEYGHPYIDADFHQPPAAFDSGQ